jgi:hypothetical protein
LTDNMIRRSSAMHPLFTLGSRASSDIMGFGAQRQGFTAIVGAMDGVVTGDAGGSRNPDAAQAEYYRQELSGLRAQAQSDLARRYIELQQLRDSGLADRAADVRRFIRALEQEIATLERLGEGLQRWL